MERRGAEERIPTTAGYTAVPGPLAQLAEQRTFNPRVAGSRPARPTSTPHHALCSADRVLVTRATVGARDVKQAGEKCGDPGLARATSRSWRPHSRWTATAGSRPGATRISTGVNPRPGSASTTTRTSSWPRFACRTASRSLTTHPNDYLSPARRTGFIPFGGSPASVPGTPTRCGCSTSHHGGRGQGHLEPELVTVSELRGSGRKLCSEPGAGDRASDPLHFRSRRSRRPVPCPRYAFSS